MRIVATDAGFDAPSSVRPGLRHIRFENRGTEVHEAMLVQLPAGMSVEDYAAAAAAGALFPEGALDYSGPGLTSPGGATELWLRVDPGRYLLFCWNHARTGTPHELVVAGAPSDDPVPEADVVLRLRDYRFELAGELRPGARVFRVETPGPSMHEADLYRLDENRTVDDLVRWRKHGGPAPARALGGVLDSHDIARIVWFRVTLEPGRYVLHCEMPMANATPAGGDEVTHADVGMYHELVVSN